MVKRISQLLMLVVSLGILSGCQQKPLTIEEAAALFVEGEFYLQEKYQAETFRANYAQAFGEEITEATLWESQTRTAVALATENVPQEVRKAIGPALSEALATKTSFTVKKIDETRVSVAISGLDLKKFQVKLTTALEEALLADIQHAGFDKIKTLEDLTRLSSNQDVKKIKELVADFQADTGKQQKILVASLGEVETTTTPKSVELKLRPTENSTSQWQVEHPEAAITELTQAFLN